MLSRAPTGSGRADWPSIKHDMAHTDWEVLLVGDAEAKAHALTTKLFAVQQLHVPNRVYLTRSGDRAWFGYRCRAAAEAKYAAWLSTSVIRHQRIRHNTGKPADV